eukprot:UN21038
MSTYCWIYVDGSAQIDGTLISDGWEYTTDNSWIIGDTIQGVSDQWECYQKFMIPVNTPVGCDAEPCLKP